MNIRNAVNIIKAKKEIKLRNDRHKIPGSYNCSSLGLTSLIGLDIPSEVPGLFSCSENKLTTLEGAPKIIGRSLFAHHNNLTSLKNIHKTITKIGLALDFDDNPIVSHVLGVLLIDGKGPFNMNYNMRVDEIVAKHRANDKDIIECQEELIQAGLKEYARL